MKKIILIWDFDGAIGLINASYPYNFNFSNLKREQDQIRIVGFAGYLSSEMLFCDYWIFSRRRY